MKRSLAVLFLSMLVVQLCLLPMAAQGEPPFTVITAPATGITDTAAILNGYLDLNSHFEACASVVYFEYGTQPGVYDKITSQQQTGNLPKERFDFSATITGLSPCTTYYAHAVGGYPVCKRSTEHTDFFAIATQCLFNNNLQGIGIGLDPVQFPELCNGIMPPSYGNEVSFQTTGCQPVGPTYIGTGTHGAGGFSASLPGPPINPSNIIIQSATLTATKVSPGEKVNVAATVANKGGSNGNTRVTLYVNGQEVESKGVSLASGQITPVDFSISRNEPGTYTVYVNGVLAGSFTVDTSVDNAILIYSLLALFTLGIIGVLYLIVKRRTA